MSHDRFSLYELSLEGVQIQDALEASEGELTPELEQRMDELLRKGPDTIEAAAMVVKQREAYAQACLDEIKRLQFRASGIIDGTNNLKERMAIALDCAFNGKVKTARFSLWTQKAADTVAFDLLEHVTPERFAQDNPEYVRTKIELDKNALKEAHKRGEPMPDGVFVDERKGKRYVRIS